MSIAIIDYGMGNLRSVAQALGKVAAGHEIRVTSRPEEVARAERVVFPGQGAMPDCMAELARRDLREAVLDAAATKPFLGICIGLQMLFSHSEEGDSPGLDCFAGKVVRFPDTMRAPTGERLKVPHMGWNTVRQETPHPVWRGIADEARFYFVHSYYVAPENPSLLAGSCEYGLRFTAAVAKANIFAIQFHPEKSARDGLLLLSNFVSWRP
ncbi:MAG: imidazole glycerol phosphate synthase subunit HisH [Zoogloeaceae bacterium]|jgi:glutamine amidotransferase|nr:imidazole glycerol phosphate synthase subunit HisH [Zoogloeaceae bacterium]